MTPRDKATELINKFSGLDKNKSGEVLALSFCHNMIAFKDITEIFSNRKVDVSFWQDTIFDIESRIIQHN